MKKGALLCLQGFIREPKPTKKGIRVLLGILDYRMQVLSASDFRNGLFYGFRR